MKKVYVIRHVQHESLGIFEGELNALGISWVYIDSFNESTEQFDIERCRGLIILGGPMNAGNTESPPFLVNEMSWIKDIVVRNIPTLGICLGAQLIAKTLGARVYRAAKKEIGYYPVRLTDVAWEDQLFLGSSPRQMVFQWHGDTFDLPEGAVLLAYGTECRNQAFRYGENIYGLQFHLEVTAKMVDFWLRETENSKELDHTSYIDPDEIMSKTKSELFRVNSLGKRVFSRFARLCQPLSTEDLVDSVAEVKPGFKTDILSFGKQPL